MATELIAERIAIGRRYVRAVDILRDLEDPQALEGYVLTPSVRDGLRRVLDGLRKGSSQRRVPDDGAVWFGEVVLRFAADPVVPGKGPKAGRRRTSPVTYSVGNRCRPIGRS